MRLLHVTHQYWPAVGGAERYITDVSEELASRGHTVDVFTSRSSDFRTWANALPATETIAGVNVHRFRAFRRTAKTWDALRYGSDRYWPRKQRRYEPFIFWGNGPVMPGLFSAIVRNGQRYDLIHISQLHYAHAWLAFTAARRTGVPVVLTPHLHPEQRQTFDVGYMRQMLARSALVVAVTHAEHEFIAQQFGPREVVTAGNGLRLSRFPEQDCATSRARFGLPGDAFVMLFLGRKEDYKGLEVCLAAFNVLRAARANIFLLAIGPETEYSRALWQQIGALPGLIVRGEVADSERLAALAACDVLIMPSLGEAFGIVFLEAWAYRKPVIGASITSVANLIADGDDGFLVAPGDATTLAARLEWLATHSEQARTIGAQGRLKLESRFTLEKTVDDIEGACLRLVRRSRRFGRRGWACA